MLILKVRNNLLGVLYMNKNIFSWIVYDVANSFLAVAIGGLFLGQWVILDNKLNDIWYGGVFALSTIILLLTSPFWGSWSDKLGKRLPFIRWLTLCLIALNGLMVFFVLSHLPAKTKVFIVLGMAVLLQYIYQISLIFYNSLLEKIATSNNRGRLSGLGEAFNNFGWIVATGFLMLFATNKIHLFGEPGRQQVFFPAFIIFIFLSLPMLFLFRETAIAKTEKVSAGGVYKKTIFGLKKLFKNNKNVFWFLIGFSLISDVILTAQLYFAVVMESLYKINDSQKFPILVLMFLVTIIASYILGRVSDKIGNKIIIMVSCLVLIGIFTLAFLSSAVFVLYLLAIFAGIGWAGYYVATRSLMIKISPPEELGEYFSFYSMFQRFASVVGPLVWGVVTILFRDYGSLKHRIAGLALVAIMIIGVFILRKVKEESSVPALGVGNINYDIV